MNGAHTEDTVQPKPPLKLASCRDRECSICDRLIEFENIVPICHTCLFEIAKLRWYMAAFNQTWLCRLGAVALMLPLIVGAVLYWANFSDAITFLFWGTALVGAVLGVALLSVRRIG